MIRRLLLIVLFAPLLAQYAPASAATQQIMMAQYAFGPGALTLHVGDTITWTNHDQAPHDVTTTSAPVSFHSPMLSTGQSWTYTVSQPGTYAYYCSIHPDMRAQITVLPAPTTAPPQQRPTTAVGAAPNTARQPAQHTAAQPDTSQAAAAAPTTATSNQSGMVAMPQATPATEQSTMDPMLLVAGLVAGVATLCLLLIGSRAAN